MGMDYIGLESCQRQHVQHAAAEESEPFVFISAHPVDVGTAEIVFVVHEIPGYAVFPDHFDPAVLPSPAELHLKITDVRHLLLVFLRNRSEHGDDHPDIMAFLRQYRGERSDNVSQSSRFDERNGFAGGEKDLHPVSILPY